MYLEQVLWSDVEHAQVKAYLLRHVDAKLQLRIPSGIDFFFYLDKTLK